MSAFEDIADEAVAEEHVRYVPEADMLFRGFMGTICCFG